MIISNTIVQVNLCKIPFAMREIRQWVVWRYENREDKPAKVPYNPITLSRAQSNNPDTWGMLEDAIAVYEKGSFSGIGFMFDLGFAGVDLDYCRNKETGEIEEWAIQIVEQLNSYTEISPSGKGLHIFIKASLPGSGIKREVDGHKIEIYDTGRYFTFTGEHLEGTPLDVNERQDAVTSLYNNVVQFKAKKPQIPEASYPPLSDTDVMDKAMNAKNGSKFERLWDGDTSQYSTPSDADFALVRILCFYSQDDCQVARLWKESKLNREKLNRDDYIQRTIAKVRSLQVEHYQPATLTPRRNRNYSEVVPSDNEKETDDPPISTDPKREAYLRKLLSNSSLMQRARMMMAKALGFQKLPWRLLNALHAYQRNSLGVRIISDQMLMQLYQATGQVENSERTIRRHKEKLWKEQERVGIELVWYWHGRQNLVKGKNYASRYISQLDRWVLSAIDKTITQNGDNYSIQDKQLKAACEEIASTIVPKQSKYKKFKPWKGKREKIQLLEKQIDQVSNRLLDLQIEYTKELVESGYNGQELDEKLLIIRSKIKLARQ